MNNSPDLTNLSCHPETPIECPRITILLPIQCSAFRTAPAWDVQMLDFKGSIHGKRKTPKVAITLSDGVTCIWCLALQIYGLKLSLAYQFEFGWTSSYFWYIVLLGDAGHYQDDTTFFRLVESSSITFTFHHGILGFRIPTYLARFRSFYQCHKIHVWYIYLRLAKFYSKYR